MTNKRYRNSHWSSLGLVKEIGDRKPVGFLALMCFLLVFYNVTIHCIKIWYIYEYIFLRKTFFFLCLLIIIM